MASRSNQYKNKGTESEIQKCREESNWKRLLELVAQLQRTAGQQSGPYSNFLTGEAKLEIYLEDYPPIEQHIHRAKTSLTDAKRYLSECTNSDSAKGTLAIEARFLLAKCCYAQGKYDQALEHLEQGGIDRLEEKSLTARVLKILAESFAIKGLCLEQQPKPNATEKEDMIKSYRKAGEIGLRYLQTVEKNQGIQGAQVQVGGAVTTEFRIGILLETALQRAPILMMKGGQIRDAVEQYRCVLRAQETTSTQSLRMTLARQLAEVLLRGVCEHEWQQIQPQQEQTPTNKVWRPEIYRGASLNIPREHIEEILLLLSISDAIAVRNVVLDRSPEVAQDRSQSIKNVTSVLDLLTIALARNIQFEILCENFEKVAKFSCDEYHIWNQFGLSLIAAGSFARGVRMLIESAQLRPKYGFDLLLAAEVTLVELKDADEALDLVEQAIEREVLYKENEILAVCYTLKGLCHEVLADSPSSDKDKSEHRALAFKAFVKARNTDPDYPQAEYFLGLHYANVHKLDEAMACARRLLELSPDYFPGMQLLIVLLTAQKKHDQALQLVEVTLQEYPGNLNLLYLKVYLEDYLYGPTKALYTARLMLREWKSSYEDLLKARQAARANELATRSTGPSSQLGIVSIPNALSGRASVLESPWTGCDGSIMAALDRSVSDALEKLTPNVNRRSRVDETAMLQLQMHIWLLTAKLYIKLEHFPEAEKAIGEAANILQYSPNVQLVRGLLHEARGEFAEAKMLFEGALSIQPNCVSALQHLALVYRQLGSHQLAETTLRRAALLAPMSPKTWFNLGKVLQESGTLSEASDCFEVAVQLELCSPIVEFSKLPRAI